MTSTTCSFRKTKTGEWVVFGPARLVKPGTVTVSLANGGTKTVTVASVGKTFTADGITACYGYTTGTSTTPAVKNENHRTASNGKVYRYADNNDRFNGNRCSGCGARGTSTFDCCGD